MAVAAVWRLGITRFFSRASAAGAGVVFIRVDIMCAGVPVAFFTFAAVVVLNPVGRDRAEGRCHIKLGVKYLLNKGRKGGSIDRVRKNAHRVVRDKDDLVFDSIDYSPLLRKGVEVRRFNHRLVTVFSETVTRKFFLGPDSGNSNILLLLLSCTNKRTCGDI
jgi:hypothetical protein